MMSITSHMKPVDTKPTVQSRPSDLAAAQHQVDQFKRNNPLPNNLDYNQITRNGADFIHNNKSFSTPIYRKISTLYTPSEITQHSTIIATLDRYFELTDQVKIIEDTIREQSARSTSGHSYANDGGLDI